MVSEHTRNGTDKALHDTCTKEENRQSQITESQHIKTFFSVGKM